MILFVMKEVYSDILVISYSLLDVGFLMPKAPTCTHTC